MKCTVQIGNKSYGFDPTEPIDIAISLKAGFDTVNCFYAPPVEMEPYRSGDFIGSTESGAPVNFYNVKLNPHGNGTHTECVGHISKEKYSVNECLKNYIHPAVLFSVYPEKQDNGDRVITEEQVREIWKDLGHESAKAVVIRTMPNDTHKLKMNYSGTNPVYIHADAVRFLVGQGIEHLLIDLPSVDREEDQGILAAHHAFWQYPENTRTHCTITELIYVPTSVKDGFYLLDIQVAAMELDASPSRPVLYRLMGE